MMGECRFHGGLWVNSFNFTEPVKRFLLRRFVTLSFHVLLVSFGLYKSDILQFFPL